MAHHLGESKEQNELRDDVILVRAEVDHCQAILQRMTGRAGQLMAEETSRVDLESLLQDLLKELPQARPGGGLAAGSVVR